MAKALTLRVVKAITLLGSTQGLNMLCNVVRMKMLATLLGPSGLGLMGALTQAADMIGNFTQLNIRTSAVPRLAATTNPTDFNNMLSATRRYSRLLGIVGMAVMFILASRLSSFTFGSGQYAWTYRIVSVAIFLQALQGCELITLQATARYKAIAASGLFTAVCGLFLAVPLYWRLRYDGIAPSIVGYALFAWLGATWFSNFKSEAPPSMASPSWRESLRIGRGFILVGMLLTVTAIATEGVNFLMMAAVRYLSGEEALGIYQSGYTLVWRYMSIFFMAFSMEFYPRLVKVIRRPSHVSLMITHQTLISAAMLTPCLAAVIILAPWLLRIFFSEAFLPAVPYVIWGAVAMSFRPLSICMSYSFLASSRNKVYCLTEIISALSGLCLNSLGYYSAGFTGLGLGTIVWMLLDLVIMLVAARIAGAPMPRPRALAAAFLPPLILSALAFLVL